MTDKYEAMREAAEKLPPGYDYVMEKEEILELLYELAALKGNADRYRWLRDDCGLVEWKSMTGSADYCLPSGRTLDVTIDATREQKTMSKYPEDKPFGEWTPEQQREFKISVRVDGKKYEVFSFGKWKPGQGVETEYDPLPYLRHRLAPEPEIPDSIDWSHVHPDFTRMYRKENWHCAGIYDKSGKLIGSALYFASYKRGNMESCTVYRPGFEPEGEK